MSATHDGVPAPRAPLSRERVLHAAVAFADANGIESLSMRKLGEAVGVDAMSLYNHVANKTDLLDGMIDVVFSEIELPAGEDGWKTAMRQRAISVRAVLSRHRWAIGLMESRTSPGPATLRHHDAVLAPCAMPASHWSAPPTPTRRSTVTSTDSRCRSEPCRSKGQSKPSHWRGPCSRSSPPTGIPTSPSLRSAMSSSPATTTPRNTNTASTSSSTTPVGYEAAGAR